MSDRGLGLQFGIFPEPSAAEPERILELVLRAERGGLDLIGIQDHPYQRRHLDALVLITWLAARTERIRFVPDVLNLPLRPPGVLAQSLASLDVLSGGRVEAGLGAGGFGDAIHAIGGPRRSPGEALAALGEAITVLRLMWSGERSVRSDGAHYALGGVHPGPVPAHPMQIWVGGAGPRMLDLIGRTADGWLPSSAYLPPDELPERMARIDAAAVAAGRDRAAVRRLYNVSGRIDDRGNGGFLQGPPDQWVEELTGLVTGGGMDSFILWPADPAEEQVERFATEVAPAVRAAVAAARGRSGD